MRKLLLLCLLIALAAPVAAVAGKRAPGDGTLAVRDGKGMVYVAARGGLIGRCEKRCQIMIDDPIPGDGSGPIVFGEEHSRHITDTAVLHTGTDIRFRIVGGAYKVRVTGNGLNLSAVGRGFVIIDGAGGDDGEYALDGGAFESLPDEKARFPVGSEKPGAFASQPGG